jgi:hypothetical protein
MAISSLVTGNAFQRPAITFSNKQTDYKLEKVSFLLNSKSSMADLGTAMSNLNSQLKKMQNISKDIIRSINSVLSTITKIDKDMTNRFRRLNKEISDSRTEFTKSLAFITPTLTGGAGATISAAALGPAAAAGAGNPANKPSTGNSKWDAFMAFVEVTAPILFKRIGPKLLLMAGLATTGPFGWAVDALVFISSISDVIELYNLWCQFTNQQPQQAAIDAAQATQNKQQTPEGSPQQTTPPPPATAPTAGAPQTAPAGAGAGRGSVVEKPGERAAASAATSAPESPSLRDPTNPATQGRGGGHTPAAPTDMSIGGETGAFGAARQSAAAPQPVRRPNEAPTPPMPQRRPAEATVQPSAPAAPVDPHTKSRSMFQAAQDAERNGDSGATALFFAADKQRQQELAGVKQAAAQPGAPVETKKAAVKSLQDPTNPKTFGRGGGHMTGEAMFGRGGGHMTGETMFGRGGGHMTGESSLGRGGGDHKSPLLDPIQGPMQSMADKQTAAIAGGMYDKDVADTYGENVDAQRRQLESTAMNDARQQSGESLVRIGPPVPDKTGETTTGRAVTPRNISMTIKGPEANAEEPSSLGAPTPTPPKPPSSPKITPEFEPGYGGKAGKILQYNLDQYNATQTSKGGEGNNVAGQNFKLTATNPWIQEFIDKQAISYQ